MSNNLKHDHIEEHFEAPDFIRDVVIGMADGLTVPFALAAGLSGAVSAVDTIVVAGIAEIAAGSIAMGLGGYLAAKTDNEHYDSELKREYREIVELPHFERKEVEDVLKQWGFEEQSLQQAVDHICSDPDRWVDFMMKYELGLDKPHPSRARNSSLTIGISYIVGGFIPLLPYMFIDQIHSALLTSVGVTLVALFVFGWVKGKFTGSSSFKSAWQTLLVGGLAAGIAFGIASMISG